MGWNFGYGCGLGMGLSCIFVMLFWVLIILGIVYFIKLIVGGKGAQEGKGADSGGGTPVEIIKIRYAKGEITREEYERMLEDLKRE